MSNTPVRSFFDTRVEEWDSVRYQDDTYISRARVAVGFIRAGGANQRVLDVGCGTGRQTVDMIAAGNTVVAADFSPEMARATRDRIRRESPSTPPMVVVADALHPPFRAGSFDAVLALGVVGFIQDRPSMFRQLHALLRPRGELVCDSGVPEPQVLFQAVSRVLNAPIELLDRMRCALRGLPAPERITGWYTQNFIKHSPQEFETLLEAAGFTPVDAGGAGFGELRVSRWVIVPWRLHTWASRTMSNLSVRRSGKFFARHALTYIVRSTRGQDAAAPAQARRETEPAQRAPALHR